jgi:DNA-binding NtrC family response regulator
MQLKLLRVIQERKFEPVGSTQTIEVDVRVVLASNQPLEQLVTEGKFRQDLYYRINVVQIELPPLRERTGDVPALAAHFLRMHASELNKQITGFSPEVLEVLRSYRYPGNVRELQNIVERAAVLSRRPTIELDELPPQLAAPSAGAGTSANPLPAAADERSSPWTPMPLEEALREPERRILLSALDANAWNRQKTAEQLGINRTTLYKKMKQHGIDGRDAA